MNIWEIFQKTTSPLNCVMEHTKYFFSSPFSSFLKFSQGSKEYGNLMMVLLLSRHPFQCVYSVRIIIPCGTSLIWKIIYKWYVLIFTLKVLGHFPIGKHYLKNKQRTATMNIMNTYFTEKEISHLTWIITTLKLFDIHIYSIIFLQNGTLWSNICLKINLLEKCLWK